MSFELLMWSLDEVRVHAALKGVMGDRLDLEALRSVAMAALTAVRPQSQSYVAAIGFPPNDDEARTEIASGDAQGIADSLYALALTGWLEVLRCDADPAVVQTLVWHLEGRDHRAGHRRLMGGSLDSLAASSGIDGLVDAVRAGSSCSLGGWLSASDVQDRLSQLRRDKAVWYEPTAELLAGQYWPPVDKTRLAYDLYEAALAVAAERGWGLRVLAFP